jgi:hypothetical protein
VLTVDQKASLRVVSKQLKSKLLIDTSLDARLLMDESFSMPSIDPQRRNQPGEESLAVLGGKVKGCDLILWDLLTSVQKTTLQPSHSRNLLVQAPLAIYQATWSPSGGIASYQLSARRPFDASATYCFCTHGTQQRSVAGIHTPLINASGMAMAL